MRKFAKLFLLGSIDPYSKSCNLQCIFRKTYKILGYNVGFELKCSIAKYNLLSELFSMWFNMKTLFYCKSSIYLLLSDIYTKYERFQTKLLSIYQQPQKLHLCYLWKWCGSRNVTFQLYVEILVSSGKTMQIKNCDQFF